MADHTPTPEERMAKSRKRLANSRVQPNSFVFSADATREILEYYAYLDDSAVRLHTHLGLKGNGSWTLWWEIRGVDGELIGCGNDSHPCPPLEDCEGG